MNKLLLVEDKINVNKGEYFLEFKKKAIVNISDEVILHNKSNCNLIVNINKNSTLNFYNLYEVNKDTQITLNLTQNSIINYNLVILNNGHNKIEITVNLNEDNCQANIKIRAININSFSNLNIICNGLIKKNISNAYLEEDIKGLIINSGKIKVSPNMDVYTNEVMANHLVTIGSFNKDELFYLQNKGLDINTVKKLLLQGFLNSGLSKYLQEQIKMEVINIE